MTRKRKETERQFLRRIDRTSHKRVKDGGPTYAEISRALDIKFRQRREADRAEGLGF